jgi:small subunit ribosomal protein S2
MANKIDVKELLEAGVHFGHMTRKWDQIWRLTYMERNGIHIINLYKTAKIGRSCRRNAKNCCIWKKNLIRSNKKQAKDIVQKKAAACNMPLHHRRWPGGMLTNL